jgi:hypothetical protein
LARNGAVTLLGNTVTSPTGLGGTGGGPPVPSTPAPSSLILVAIALVCAGIYQACRRLPNLFGRS